MVRRCARCPEGPGPAGSVTSVLGIVRQPRWLGLTALVLLLVPVFLWLSQWQYHRHLDRRAANALVRANYAQPPQPLDDVLPADGVVREQQEWRQVTLAGRWDESGEVLVRNRPQEGRNGFLVVTPLVPDQGPALLVSRGFVPNAATATERPDVPAPQPGRVEVVARLQPAEQPRSTEGLPPGQVLSIDPAVIAASAGLDVVDGYATLVREEPTPETVLPGAEEPSLSPGPHLSYSVQWVLFALLAVGGWVELTRRAIQELRADAAPAPARAGPG